MPVIKEWRDVLPYVNRLKDLNDFGLTVTGLKAGKYEVKIDAQVVGAYTADELAAGRNIGTAGKGPVHEQGMKVLAAIKAKNDVVSKRFFQVVRFDPKATLPEWVSGLIDDLPAKRAGAVGEPRAEKIAEKQAEVYRLAKPVIASGRSRPRSDRRIAVPFLAAAVRLTGYTGSESTRGAVRRSGATYCYTMSYFMTHPAAHGLLYGLAATPSADLELTTSDFNET